MDTKATRLIYKRKFTIYIFQTKLFTGRYYSYTSAPYFEGLVYSCLLIYKRDNWYAFMP